MGVWLGCWLVNPLALALSLGERGASLVEGEGIEVKLERVGRVEAPAG